MSLAIPQTEITSGPSSDGQIIADGNTPYSTGWLFVFNDTVEIAMSKGTGQGQASFGPWIPGAPGLFPLAGGKPSPQKPNPDYIFGLRIRNLTASPPVNPQVFGALFQDGEANILPSSQLTGTLSPGGNFNPGTGAALLTGDVVWRAANTRTDAVLCDGSSYDSVADPSFASLFQVIGTTFGGTGANAFNVPDLRDRSVFGPGINTGNVGADDGNAYGSRGPYVIVTTGGALAGGVINAAQSGTYPLAGYMALQPFIIK